MVKISNRLLSLTKYVQSEDKIMDVGCDHALFDIYLIDKGIVNKVIVCDVNENALQNGINNIEKYGFEKRIIPMLGYGIEKSPECDVDTLVISGMGSKNIIDIMSSPYLSKFYKLILQANNNHEDLRKFLMEAGYRIIDEEVIVDQKKTYINIVAIKSYDRVEYNSDELDFGPVLIKDKNNIDYFKDLLSTYYNILEKSNSDILRDKVKRLESIIDKLVNE